MGCASLHSRSRQSFGLSSVTGVPLGCVWRLQIPLMHVCCAHGLLFGPPHGMPSGIVETTHALCSHAYTAQSVGAGQSEAFTHPPEPPEPLGIPPEPPPPAGAPAAPPPP